LEHRSYQRFEHCCSRKRHGERLRGGERLFLFGIQRGGGNGQSNAIGTNDYKQQKSAVLFW
jgi:hypothetical protein